MSAESKPSHFEIVPPIIWNEGNDLTAYPSVEAMILQLEVWYVLENRGEFHDSTGRVLEARVNHGKISLVPTTRMAKDIVDLKMRVIRTILLNGQSREDLSQLPLDRLAHLLLEEQEEYARTHSIWKDLRAWLSKWLLVKRQKF